MIILLNSLESVKIVYNYLNMKKTVVTILSIVIIIAIIYPIFYFFNTKIDIKPSDGSNLIVVTFPIKDSEISSPLSIAGRARSSWFIDGSFPIVLVDSYKNVIAEGHATAQGDFTTTEFIKFAGNIQFNNYIKGSKGTLILKGSDSLEIPIIFK